MAGGCTGTQWHAPRGAARAARRPSRQLSVRAAAPRLPTHASLPTPAAAQQDLSLEIERCGDVVDALRRFTAPERLDGANAYKCEACRRLVAARKQMTVFDDPNSAWARWGKRVEARAHPAAGPPPRQAVGSRSYAPPPASPAPLTPAPAPPPPRPPPPVLVIHLKRFDGFLGGKISGHVAFPETLDLTPFMSAHKRAPRRWQRPRGGGSGGSGSGSGGGSSSSSGDGSGGSAGGAAGEGGGDELRVELGRSAYRLHSVLVHAGAAATSGHYYSFVRDGLNCWWCANDSSVYRVAWQRVQEQDAYLLFYVRETMKPIAELPVPAPPPPPPPAGAAPAGAAKRPAPIGPQLPPGLAAKRQRVGEEDEEEGGPGGGGAPAIGPALPPNWAGGAGAGAGAAGPSAFSRTAAGVSAAAAAAPAPARPRPGPAAGGTTRIGGPPLRLLKVAPRPAAPAAAPSQQQQQQQQEQQQEQQQQQQEEEAAAAAGAAPQPRHAPAVAPAPAAPPQPRPQTGSSSAAAAAAAARDPGLAALHKVVSSALLARLRGSAAARLLREAARGRLAAGLPLEPPSAMPAAAKLPLQQAVGAAATREAWQLLSEGLREGPGLAAWRARVESAAREEVAAAGGRRGGAGGGRAGG
jgi:hypothetical protein